MMKRFLVLGAICALTLPTFAAEKPRLKTIHRVRKDRYDYEITYPQWNANSAVKRAANWQFRHTAYATWYSLLTTEKEFAVKPGDGRGLGNGNYYEMEPNVSLQRRDLVSAYFTSESYFGGAHPNHDFLTLNVGLVNGKPKLLSIYDICLPGKTKEVAAKAWKMLKDVEGTDWIQDGTMKADDPALTHTWIAQRKSLLLLYAPYVVGSYASGPQEVEIPYSELRGVLDPNGPLKGLLKP